MVYKVKNGRKKMTYVDLLSGDEKKIYYFGWFAS